MCSSDLSPLWGWTVARFGPRLTAIAGLVIWALTCFWAGASHSYGNLLASRIALGVGEAICYPMTLALVANWFALRERGKATAYWWIGTMIGPMLRGSSSRVSLFMPAGADSSMRWAFSRSSCRCR